MRVVSESTEKPGVFAEGDARRPDEAKVRADMKISITERAAAAAKTMLAKRGTPEAVVRLGIKGGGCTGLAYVIEFDDRPPRKTDLLFERDGFRVVVDPKSLVYLNGTELDYVQTLMKSGFQLSNPNEKRACGCGESFSV
jgi:iron-sulfur cluster assembly protein